MSAGVLPSVPIAEVVGTSNRSGSNQTTGFPMSSERFLRLEEVMSRTGLKRSTVYLRMKQGRFPHPIPLGCPQIVGWMESEVNEWMQGQVRASRQAGV